MNNVYPVILTTVENAVLVEVPDLQILTEGKDVMNAMAMARDAIGLKVTTMEDLGQEIPNASEIDRVNVHNGTFCEEGESFVTLVDVDFVEYRRKMEQRMVRRNVTLPSWLDFEATKAKINVSKVLQEALKKELGVVK